MPQSSLLRAISATLALGATLLLSLDAIAPHSHPALELPAIPTASAQRGVRAAVSTILEVFQAYPPVLTVTPSGVLEITDGSSNASVKVVSSRQPSCQETLVVHSFGWSYGTPYVGPYTPPSCSFNRVTWNLTVTAAGKQFDRLGSVSFGDIELFRTSTAEPTQNGIAWVYLKDMTSFLSLFKQNQTIIFDLGNLINHVYTSPFNVTLTAAFFTAEDSIDPADVILPVSKRQGAIGQPSYYNVPEESASNVIILPRNTKKAVFTISATGQNKEEFWWSNVLQSDVDTFPSFGPLYGHSPFREVQLFIDGMLAGVAWPFPIVFTGGIVPGLWRPLVGIDAFDLKEDEIDITPWLPLLCDGKPHDFTIRVSGLADDGNGSAVLSETTDAYWLVAGKVFVWLDVPGHITTGLGPSCNTPAPIFHVSSDAYDGADGSNETLVDQVDAQRSLSCHSTINTSSGKQLVSWSQSLSYWSAGNYTDHGNIQTNIQQTSGCDVSSSGYAKRYSYPLYVYSIMGKLADNITTTGVINRHKSVQTLGQPVFPTGLESFLNAEDVRQALESFQGASLATSQSGSATYIANTTESTSYSFGTSVQDMVFAGVSSTSSPRLDLFPAITQSRELFRRHVGAVNGTILDDEETLVNTSIGHMHEGGWSQEGAPLSGFPGRGGLRGVLAPNGRESKIRKEGVFGPASTDL